MSDTEFCTTAFVRGGKLTVRNREHFAEFCGEQRDGEFIVTIRRATATRSQQQNAWYWSGIIGALYRWSKKRDHGMTAEDLHVMCKMKFLPKHLVMSDGNGEIVAEYVVGGSTTKLNKQDFGAYCEAIRQWAAEELHLDIPDPDQHHREREAEAEEAA